MLKTATYDAQPAAVLLCPLPDGGTDIWLRDNIAECTQNDDDGTQWTANEAYMQCTSTPTAEEIAEEWAYWWAAASAYTGTETTYEPTDAERLAAAESAILALMMGGM